MCPCGFTFRWWRCYKKNKRLSKEIEECREREADMKGLVDEVNFNANLAEQRSDRNEQYSRLWNLKILFIPEKRGPAPESEQHQKRVKRKPCVCSMSCWDRNTSHQIIWTSCTEW